MKKFALQYLVYSTLFLLIFSCNVQKFATSSQMGSSVLTPSTKQLSIISYTLVTTTQVHIIPATATPTFTLTSETKESVELPTPKPTKFAPLTPFPTMMPLTSTVQLDLPSNWDQYDTKSVLTGNADTIGKLINWIGGDIDKFVVYVKNFVLMANPDLYGYFKEPPLWYNLTDFDDDGKNELLLALPAFRGQGDKLEGFCGLAMCPGFIFIFEQENGQFIPAYKFENSPENYEFDYPQLFVTEDINGDGVIEIVISENWCGAHTCGTNLTIGVWNEEAWRILGKVNNSYNETYIVDENNDGIKEFKSYGGTVGSVGGGLQRKRTMIYEWLEGEYKLSKTIPDPNDHPYYLVLDAHTALTNNNYNLAFELAIQVINMAGFPRNDYTLIDDWAENRIGSFARIEAMLVYAHAQDLERMQNLLDELIAEYDELDNPYVFAAQTLLQTYQHTQDLVNACQAMAEVVQANPDKAEFFHWYGYATERLRMEDICPLSK